MSVVTVDGEGNFHKKIYMKDGYPQKVFKDDKLLFPDFVMVNSGGHASYGNLPYKTTIYGGDLGANNLFQPYSSKEFNADNKGMYKYTEYYTDTKCYGEGCELVDTFNLEKKPRKYFPGQNETPLSSCGDAIALDVSKFREYLSQLDFSSKVFLYCKISADTDSVEGYAKAHRLPTSNIDYDNSFDPKIRFGVSYSILYKKVYNEETGIREVTGIYGNKYTGYEYIKYYPKMDGCSNMVDIECTLNDEDIYFGCTDKYLTMVYPNSDMILGNGVSSCIEKIGIMNYDTYASYIADKIYITPHFEYYSGQFAMKGGQNKVNLFVNGALSGEWGVSFDKQTPKELTLCENLEVNEFWCHDRGAYTLGTKFDTYGNTYDITSTFISNNEILFSANEKVYPFSSQFVQDFYNYASSVGDFKTDFGKRGEEKVEKFPIDYYPSYEDHINGYTKQYWPGGDIHYSYGSPAYLDTNQVDLKPSTGAKFILDDTFKSTQYVNNIEPNENVKYGSLLNTVYAIQANQSRQNKMLVKYEFDARTKFKTVDNHKLPICLTFFNNNSGSKYYYPSYEGLGTLVSSNLDLVNLCGDNWYVNDDWRHYCFTALTDYYGLPRSISGGADTYTYYTLVPYFTLWGECFKRVDGKFVTPYEVKNVTTKLYI